MTERSPTNWSKHGAIASYLGAAFGAIAVVMVWPNSRPSAPTIAHQPITFPGVHIMALLAQWLFGSLYVVGIGLGGYFHWKAASIRNISKSDTADNRGVTSDDAVADFSIAENPSGNWLYGWSNDMLGSQFEFHRNRRDNAPPGMPRWDSPQINDLGVSCNQTGNSIRGCSFTVPPHTLHLHPGQGGQYDVVRWICPKRGTYQITGNFCGLDDQTTVADTDVNVVINSKTSLFPSRPILFGKGTRELFTFTGISLNAKDTVDFIVGAGPSGSHAADSTGLQAKIIRQ